MKRFGTRRGLQALLIAAAALLVYCNTFSVPFLFDDEPNVSGNPFIKNPSFLLHPADYCSGLAAPSVAKTICRFYQTRYVGYVTFAADYALHGLRVGGYHAVNLLIHIGNAFLVFVLVLLLERTPFMRRASSQGSSLDGYIPFFAALLFAVHPVQTQAVTYIVQRFASLAALFYLLSFTLYIKWRLVSLQTSDSEHHARLSPFASRLAPVFWYLSSLISAVLAMKTKEIAFTLPVMIGLAEAMFFSGPLRRRALPLLPYFLAMLIIPLSLLDIGKPLGEMLGEMNEATRVVTPVSRWEYLLTQFRVVLTYIRLLFLPAGQNLDHDYPLSHSFFEPATLVSFLFLASILGLAVYLYNRSRRGPSALRLVSFGIFWFSIALSVESSFIPIVDVIFEHRLYLPAAGAFIAVVSGVFYGAGALSGRRPWAAPAAVAVFTAAALALGTAAFLRNRVWQDEITLWEDVVRKSPDKARGYHNLGVAYVDQYGEKDPAKVSHAIDLLSTAMTIGPAMSQGYASRALAWCDLGQYPRAVEDYTKAIEQDPDFSPAYNGRGRAYFLTGRDAEALQDYSKAIALNPYFAAAYNNRGALFLKQGAYGAALEDFKKAVGMDPDKAEHYSNLGAVYHELGRFDMAVENYSRAVALKADLTTAYFNRGLAYERQKLYDRALNDFSEAARQDPRLDKAWLHRGLSYVSLGEPGKAVPDLKKACAMGNRRACDALSRL